MVASGDVQRRRTPFGRNEDHRRDPRPDEGLSSDDVREWRKVLCSIGSGPHGELLDLSGRTFRAYAGRHGYELDLHWEDPPADRPAAWAKIPVIQAALVRGDIVLWIDADAAIVDTSIDIAELLGMRDLMGLVAKDSPESEGPILNTGVWLLWNHRRTRRFLRDVWRSTEFIDHKWWENAAVMREPGYQLAPQVRLVAPTQMYRRTATLGNEWNSTPGEPSPAPRIVHVPGEPLVDRLSGLEQAVEHLRENDGTA